MSKKATGRSTKRLPRQGRGESTGLSVHGTSYSTTPFIIQAGRALMTGMRHQIRESDPLFLTREVFFLMRERFFGGRSASKEQSDRVVTKAEAVRRLPTIFAISILLLSGKERDEVLADLQEWYEELVETRGIGWARFFVAGKLLSAISGHVLTVAERVAGIIGKVWGRQKG